MPALTIDSGNRDSGSYPIGAGQVQGWLAEFDGGRNEVKAALARFLRKGFYGVPRNFEQRLDRETVASLMAWLELNDLARLSCGVLGLSSEAGHPHKFILDEALPREWGKRLQDRYVRHGDQEGARFEGALDNWRSYGGYFSEQSWRCCQVARAVRYGLEDAFAALSIGAEE